MHLENWRRLFKIVFETNEAPDTLVYENYWIRNGELDIEQKQLRIEGKFTDDIPAPISLEQQRSMIENLLQAYLLAASQMTTVPEQYRIGSNWGGFLKSTRKEFYRAVDEQNVDELSLLLNNFCRNCMSTGILGGEPGFLHFKNVPMSNDFIHDFNAWKYSVGQVDACKNLAMAPVGNPYGYNVSGLLISNNCFYNDYRASFCSRLLDQIQHSIVAEIGGGYGGFAYSLLKRDGVKTYLNFDIPENLIVSSYHLSLAFPEKRILLYEKGVTLDPETIRKYDIILMPNFMLPELADLSVDLFVNTISFSEMEYSTIAAYFNQIERICKRFFYHENLAHAPRDYKGYPASVFPALKGFSNLTVSPSRWAHFDLYSAQHIYMEHLLMRTSLTTV